MSKEDELRDILDQAVQEIAAESNPRAWLSWVVYLLARLEEQAARSGASSNRESYMEMLAALQDEIRNRTRTGGWH
ncbi:MAG: hypothetical protein M3Y68_13820 [Chloroflexota bacterium]|nr:hypothetical protein [Chloroflexota bacterium]